MSSFENALQAIRAIGKNTAAQASVDVDAKARFPRESFDALKKEKLLSVWAPRDFGGAGLTFTQVAQLCMTLGEYCGSSAMIYAMHQIQVACLLRCKSHSNSQKWLRALAERELLFGSATSEAGVGGDVRTSICFLDHQNNRVKLKKNATVISYGAHADAIFVTARKDKDAPASEQFLTVAPKNDYKLEQTSEWNTLGMRGTCSNGYVISVDTEADNVMPMPYAELSAHTMLPTSHALWASLWVGIASDAFSKARKFVRAEARKKPGQMPPGAIRLAETSSQLQLMKSHVLETVKHYEEIENDLDATTSMGFAIRMNNLKMSTSQMAVDVVNRSLLTAGIHAYRNDTEFSMGRQLRDVHSAALMVSNDRILGANASLHLVSREE